MPIYKNKRIDNLKPIRAYSKGWLTYEDYRTHLEWEGQNFKERHIKTFVYIDGAYVGTATSKTKLWEIIQKFNIE